MKQREIKFRAWDKKEKIMLNAVNVVNGFRSLENGQITISQLFDEEKGKRYTPLQYTDLKDKNGKEIYEGDMVKGVHIRKTSRDSNELQIIGVVDFKEGMFGLTNQLDDDAYSLNRIIVEKIIGNICENPELIKK